MKKSIYVKKNNGNHKFDDLKHRRYEDSMRINLFLESGDTNILENVIQQRKGTFGFAEEEYSFYGKLYQYNKMLPEGFGGMVVNSIISNEREYKSYFEDNFFHFKQCALNIK